MGYFTVKEFGTNVYSIYEKKGVGEILIVGDEKALLMDTGYGNPELIDEVKKITDKPLMVMNSHVHGDHSNGNGLFGEVYVGTNDIPQDDVESDDAKLIRMVLAGIDAKKIFLLRRPMTKMLKEFALRKEGVTFLQLPETIDLGGRVLQVVECPGHTKGSVLLLDPADKTIYGGDAINAGLWMFTGLDYKVKAYGKHLEEVAKLEGYDWIYASHEKEKRPFSFIKEYAAFLQRVALEPSKKIGVPGLDEKVHIYREKHPEHGNMMVFYLPSQLESE